MKRDMPAAAETAASVHTVLFRTPCPHAFVTGVFTRPFLGKDVCVCVYVRVRVYVYQFFLPASENSLMHVLAPKHVLDLFDAMSSYWSAF